MASLNFKSAVFRLRWQSTSSTAKKLLKNNRSIYLTTILAKKHLNYWKTTRSLYILKVRSTSDRDRDLDLTIIIFAEDFFSFIGGGDRPSFRWILVGPQKSGSTFHKDPNSTSAWNALVSGAKKWVMFPPDVAPPGVIPSDDGMKVINIVRL